MDLEIILILIASAFAAGWVDAIIGGGGLILIPSALSFSALGAGFAARIFYFSDLVSDDLVSEPLRKIEPGVNSWTASVISSKLKYPSPGAASKEENNSPTLASSTLSSKLSNFNSSLRQAWYESRSATLSCDCTRLRSTT